MTQNKLELFLTGNVLVEGTTSTLTLEDFSGKDKITTTNAICPEQNKPLADVLRNFSSDPPLRLLRRSNGGLHRRSRGKVETIGARYE